ncbi:MAG: hypothetical protein QXV37_00230 [Candidatus Jordarchaeaceae archaeon]
MRKGEILNLKKEDIDRNLRCIISKSHSGETKHSEISFYNEGAEACLKEFEEKQRPWQRKSEKLFTIRHEAFIYG